MDLHMRQVKTIEAFCLRHELDDARKRELLMRQAHRNINSLIIGWGRISKGWNTLINEATTPETARMYQAMKDRSKQKQVEEILEIFEEAYNEPMSDDENEQHHTHNATMGENP